jgi:UDP-N-acetylglucosamine--N-acetylmuramyl-(pentapeptide) pyrophosphoryl-undecaprenol N-acetylglucosamine transferase
MKKDKGNIVFVGGHAATTAYSVFLSAKNTEVFDGYSFHWVGSSTSHSGVKSAPFEHGLFPKIGIKTHYLHAAKLDRKITRHSLGNLLNIVRAGVGAFILISRLKPSLVLSFGGSISLPVVIASWINRVPVLVHEQTTMAGLSNRIGAFFARKVLLSRENSLQFFDRSKCEIVGNPINPAIVATKVTVGGEKLPKLVILGGSRGSSVINKLVFENISELVKKYDVHHVVGNLDFNASKNYRFKNYHPYSFIEPTHMGSLYSGCHLMVARSGANTVSEVLYLGIPTLFIPIPWASLDEQGENARFAEKLGIAKILDQNKIDLQSFVKNIDQLHKDSKRMREKWTRASLPHDELAAKKICDQISVVL